MRRVDKQITYTLWHTCSHLHDHDNCTDANCKDAGQPPHLRAGMNWPMYIGGKIIGERNHSSFLFGLGCYFYHAHNQDAAYGRFLLFAYHDHRPYVARGILYANSFGRILYDARNHDAVYVRYESILVGDHRLHVDSLSLGVNEGGCHEFRYNQAEDAHRHFVRGHPPPSRRQIVP